MNGSSPRLVLLFGARGLGSLEEWYKKASSGSRYTDEAGRVGEFGHIPSSMGPA